MVYQTRIPVQADKRFSLDNLDTGNPQSLVRKLAPAIPAPLASSFIYNTCIDVIFDNMSYFWRLKPIWIYPREVWCAQWGVNAYKANRIGHNFIDVIEEDTEMDYPLAMWSRYLQLWVLIDGNHRNYCAYFNGVHRIAGYAPKYNKGTTELDSAIKKLQNLNARYAG